MMNVFHLRAASVALAAICCIAVGGSVWAHHPGHPEEPNPSPNLTLHQVVGFGSVTIDYGRPGVKGREGKIWGELVPFNEGKPRPWGAGANGNSVITFEQNVKINGHDLAAGTYGLMMIPSEKEWTVIFNSNGSRLGILKYTAEEDVLRVPTAPYRVPATEWLTYDIQKTSHFTADLSMTWENVRIVLEITAPNEKPEKKSS